MVYTVHYKRSNHNSFAWYLLLITIVLSTLNRRINKTALITKVQSHKQGNLIDKYMASKRVHVWLPNMHILMIFDFLYKIIYAHRVKRHLHKLSLCDIIIFRPPFWIPLKSISLTSLCSDSDIREDVVDNSEYFTKSWKSLRKSWKLE